MNIYKITNNINGKIYIGQTKRSPEKRLSEHCRKSAKTTLSAAIQKYGKENFSMVLVEVVDADNINEREKYWIAHFDTAVPNGYNVSIGGEGIKDTPLTTRQKMSIAAKGNKNNLGTKYSIETKLKMSLLKKGIRIKSTVVIAINKNCDIFEFDAIEDAAKSLNIKRRSISNALNGWSKSAGGFTFKYKGDI